MAVISQLQFRSVMIHNHFRNPGLPGKPAVEVKRRLSAVEELESVVSANLQRAVRLRQSIVHKSIDLSFGEIANMRKAKELIIQPEYQRLFRWSAEQRSRLVESILLELPIPQIFVIENADGVFELIDGLQRISSILQFIEPTAIDLPALSLEGCDIIKNLNGKEYADLPLSLKLRLKRSTVRTIVIKRQSKSFLRYEMFKRLNTGGSLLSPQEIRNCSSRMLGEDGIKFYGLLQKLSEFPSFVATTQTLALQDVEQKANEELVLRFFAAKNARAEFRGSVRDWLDDYMEPILRLAASGNLGGQAFKLSCLKWPNSLMRLIRSQIFGLACHERSMRVLVSNVRCSADTRPSSDSW